MASEATFGSTKVLLKRGDITQENADAIVNAANSSLLGGGGVDGAIHRAGGPSILAECKEIRARLGGPLPTGEAVVTGAGDLPTRHVVHAVGPVWHGGDSGEPELLRAAYRNSLSRAAEVGARTVTFPSISTGAYGYPVRQAARITVGTVKEWAEEHDGLLQEVRFVLFSDGDLEAYKEALVMLFGS
jgi:O-acetyl-ADP-ribose deacetylase (regulator of RNase III)